MNLAKHLESKKDSCIKPKENASCKAGITTKIQRCCNFFFLKLNEIKKMDKNQASILDIMVQKLLTQIQ